MVQGDGASQTVRSRLGLLGVEPPVGVDVNHLRGSCAIVAFAVKSGCWWRLRVHGAALLKVLANRVGAGVLASCDEAVTLGQDGVPRPPAGRGDESRLGTSCEM